MDDNDYADSGPFEGQGADLHAALEDAWAHAKGKTNARTFSVDSIAIVAENPITTYIVIISPTG
jgi:hypothetical protein